MNQSNKNKLIIETYQIITTHSKYSLSIQHLKLVLVFNI
jgi:hypothetical protein